MLHEASKQLSAFFVTSALVSTLLPLHSIAEAEISQPQVQAKCTNSRNPQSQNKQISRKRLLTESLKLNQLGIPQRLGDAGSR